MSKRQRSPSLSGPQKTRRHQNSAIPLKKSNGSKPFTKKARFSNNDDYVDNDSDNDDRGGSILVDDDVENNSDLEELNRKGRRRVRTEGYDSDSDSADDDAGDGGDKDGQGGGDDDDVDMFSTEASTSEPKSNDPSGRKNKQGRYLSLNEIEGQELDDPSSRRSRSRSRSATPVDPEIAKRQTMGYTLSAFNMRSEMEEGKFTQDGSFVRTYDPHLAHDRWMDDVVDDTSIQAAARAKRKRDKLIFQKEREEKQKEAEVSGKHSKERLILQVLAMLRKGETPLEALSRLGTKKKNDAKRKGSKASEDITTLTALASTLMSMGEADIYSKTHRQLVAELPLSPNQTPAPCADREYEYHWVTPSIDSQPPGDEVPAKAIFGPFPLSDMQSWFSASYFGSEGEKIWIRRVHCDVNFTNADDDDEFAWTIEKRRGSWGKWDDVVES